MLKLYIGIQMFLLIIFIITCTSKASAENLVISLGLDVPLQTTNISDLIKYMDDRLPRFFGKIDYYICVSPNDLSQDSSELFYYMKNSKGIQILFPFRNIIVPYCGFGVLPSTHISEDALFMHVSMSFILNGGFEEDLLNFINIRSYQNIIACGVSLTELEKSSILTLGHCLSKYMIMKKESAISIYNFMKSRSSIDNSIEAKFLDAMKHHNITFSLPHNKDTSTALEYPKRLFDWKVTEMSLESGPCSLWWPLNNTEIFIPDHMKTAESSFLLFVELYCSHEGYSDELTSQTFSRKYEGRIIISNTVFGLPAIPNKKMLTVSQFYLNIRLYSETSDRLDDVISESGIENIAILVNEINENGVETLVSNISLKLNFVFGSLLLEQEAVESAKGVQLALPHNTMDSYHATLSSIHSIMQRKPREDFPVLLNMLGLLGTAVEVGVQRGIFSESMLSVWRGNRYLMVDPWTYFDNNFYPDPATAARQEEQNQIFMEAKDRVNKFGDRAMMLRLPSMAASLLLPDDSVDFVFIDALHDYYNVMLDMLAWWPKVRGGGVLAGHDFPYRTVQFAVLEFGRKMKLPVYTTSDLSWYILKI